MVEIRSKTIILGTVVAFCAMIALSHCGPVETTGWFQNTWFFRRLSDAEKRALISLAIAYHDAPESSDDVIVFPTNPIKPKADEIPTTLFTAMMNGNVPKKWMKNFIGWLRNNYKITDNSFNLYRHDFTDVLCNADNSTCYSVKDVGQGCCPFD